MDSARSSWPITSKAWRSLALSYRRNLGEILLGWSAQVYPLETTYDREFLEALLGALDIAHEGLIAERTDA